MVQDVKLPKEEVPPPTEEAGRISGKLTALNQEFILLAKEINRSMNNSVLPENKTEMAKKREQELVSNIGEVVLRIEEISPARGLLGMCILNLRLALSLKDA